MKILWLSHLIPYPPKGGVLQRSYNLIKEVSKYHELDLMAFNQEQLIMPLFDTCEQGVQEARVELSKFCKNVDFFSIPCLKSDFHKGLTAFVSLFTQPYNLNWLRSSAFEQALKEKIVNNHYDLVHFDTISLLPFLKFIPSNMATCLDHHNIESHMLLRRSKKDKNWLKKLYYFQEGRRLKVVEKKYCSQFNLNITCSDIDAERLSMISTGSNILTIPNGVDINFFKSTNIKTKDNRLIFVGRMNQYPNVEAVLYIAEKLWPKLKEKYHNLHCDILGPNPPERLINISKNLQDFHVHGFVNDVRPYIEESTIYLCPIQDGGGTKLKILDAMAMSKAIVAHPIACEGIDVTDDLNVVLAENETTFIDKIGFLLNSPERRLEIGLEGRKLVEEKYGFEAIGSKLSQAFKSISSIN